MVKKKTAVIDTEGMPLGSKLTRDKFEEWVYGHVQEIEHVQLLLAQPLVDEPARLVQQLQEAEAWFERMNSLYADAKAFYYLEKRAALVARGDDITDLDREAIQKSEIVDQRRVMDTLEGIVESMRTRMMLGMNLRKAHIAERSTDRPQEER